MRDWKNAISTLSVLDPSIYSADPAPITVDRAGFEAVTFALTIGAGGVAFSATNRIDVYFEDSDDGVAWFGTLADSTTPNNFPDQNVADTDKGTGRVMSINSPHPATTVHRWGYLGGVNGERRYLRLRIDFVGTHANGTPMSALVILGEGRQLPTVA